MESKAIPAMMRKPDTGALKSELHEQHQRDLAALVKAQQMERKMARVCVTVKLDHGTLTAKPETIHHILTERGYKLAEIEEIMKTAK